MATQRGDDAPEPSMDEILASIRRIIAEEPIGSRPGPVPAKSNQPFASDDAADFGPPHRAAGPAHPADADDDSASASDLLSRLIDATGGAGTDGRRAEPAPAAPPAPGADSPLRQRSSWLFAQSGSIPRPRGTGHAVAPAVAPLPSPLDLAGPPEGPAQAPLPPTPAPLDGAVARPSPAPQPAAARSRPEERMDAGGRLAGEAGSPPGARADGTSLAAPLPGADVSVGEHGAAGALVGGEAAALPDAPGEAPVTPAPVMPAPATAVSAYNALAQGLAAAGAAARAPLAGAGPAPAVEQAAAEQPVAATPAEPPSAAVPPPVAPPAPESPGATPGGPRSMEETVADLLRPMLRDWLDANMPRIVEQALKVELEGGAKAPAGKDGSE